MRVSFAMTYSNLTQNIERNQTDINQLSSQISTGIRLTAPGDDPSAWSQAFLMKQNIRESQTYQSNIEYAQSWNQATENALNQMSDLLVKAKQIAVGSVSANSKQSQLANADSVQKLLDEAGALVNTQFNNSYLFSGRSTSTIPFQTADSTAPDYLTYKGDTDSIDIRASKNITDTINLNGQDAFNVTDSQTGWTGNVLQLLNQVKTAISNSATSGDTSSISNLMSTIDAASTQIDNDQTQVGNRLDKFDAQLSTLQQLNVTQQTALSNTQDTDMATAITQLQQKQTAFQAALELTASVGKLSLTQYL